MGQDSRSFAGADAVAADTVAADNVDHNTCQYAVPRMWLDGRAAAAAAAAAAAGVVAAVAPAAVATFLAEQTALGY